MAAKKQAAPSKQAAKKSNQSEGKSERTQKSGAGDAIASLVADHRKVKTLFEEFASLKEDDGSAEDKQRVVEQICLELKIHTALEEEIFYPAVREAIDDEDLMDEALVEHAGAKDLVAQLEGMDTDDELYDAKVTVLGEQIDHHVEEEESEMFPEAKKAKVNTPELAQEMETRRAELKAELGADADSDEEDEEEEEEEEA